MASYKYLLSKNTAAKNSRVNVIDLMRRAKIEKVKDKKSNLIYAGAALSALVVSGLIISL